MNQPPRDVPGSRGTDAEVRLERALLDAQSSPSLPRVSKARRHGLTREVGLRLYRSQVTSRHLDYAARRLRAQGVGYYTIGSSGHEGNAVVAAALRPTDPALLHYRSCAFFVERAAQRPGHDPVRDVLLGLVAGRDEPIAGGRHKVFGSRELFVWPQTSTIGSHVPKAVGMALAIERLLRTPEPFEREPAIPEDAIVVCSFGDASIGHSVVAGAIATVVRAVHQHLRVPLLMVCEDNGLGISVPTPPGFIERAIGSQPGLTYVSADGCDLADAYQAARATVDHVRARRRPVFLHLSCVRLMGHAGSDVEEAYRTRAEIEADEMRDPLIGTVRTLVDHGFATGDELAAIYRDVGIAVMAQATAIAKAEHLRDARDVMWPISPRRPGRVARAATTTAPEDKRRKSFDGRPPEDRGPLTLAAQVNAALSDLLLVNPKAILFGEDVGRKGGVYGVTRGLFLRFGARRVFDTPLDETTILGLAIGAAQIGFVPIPEIQYLAYLHNAIDQLRGEAASLSFFSQGQFKNGMVVRIAGLAYQKGFGGHFHNENSVAALRDIPGLVVAVPARGGDAAAMLRSCVAAAEVDGTVSVFLEPIALYHTRDLHQRDDGGWGDPYHPGEHVPIGSPRVYDVPEDASLGADRRLLIVTFGNGVPMSLRAARELASTDRVATRVMDLRWLAPLPIEPVIAEARRATAVLVVDETRSSGSVSEGIVARMIDAGFDGPLTRVTSADSFVPLGPAADHVLLSEAQIKTAARSLVAKALRQPGALRGQ